MKIRLLIAILLSASVVCGIEGRLCADEYLIGSDDVLDMSVAKDQSLTKAYTVDQDGVISMPYLKEVKVSGLTVEGAAQMITDRLKNEGFLIAPEVTINVKEHRSQKVMVFGKVKKPGSYYLKGKTAVLDLLSQIEQPEGEGGIMVILRKKPDGAEEKITVDLNALVLNGDLSQNIEILGGDKVVLQRVSSGQQVFVLGEVKTAGSYNVEPGATVLDVVRSAGGFTDVADKHSVKIIRLVNGKEETIPLDLNKIEEGDLSGNIELLSQDKIVVPQKVTSQQMIYVLGEVRQPGPYNVNKAMTVLEAIHLAGGFTDFASKGKAKVIREQEDGSKVNIMINLNKIQKGDKSEDITLQAGDVVVALKSWL